MDAVIRNLPSAGAFCSAVTLRSPSVFANQVTRSTSHVTRHPCARIGSPHLSGGGPSRKIQFVFSGVAGGRLMGGRSGPPLRAGCLWARQRPTLDPVRQPQLPLGRDRSRRRLKGRWAWHTTASRRCTAAASDRGEKSIGTRIVFRSNIGAPLSPGCFPGGQTLITGQGASRMIP